MQRSPQRLFHTPPFPHLHPRYRCRCGITWAAETGPPGFLPTSGCMGKESSVTHHCSTAVALDQQSLCWRPRAAETKCHERQKCFVLQFWRVHVQSQGVARAMPPLNLWENPSVPPPASGGLWALCGPSSACRCASRRCSVFTAIFLQGHHSYGGRAPACSWMTSP